MQSLEERRAEDLRRWRYDELRKAGYPPDAAALLTERDVDIHQARDLLARGCSVALALRILN